MWKNKALSLLGLAMRAGKIVSGESLTEGAIKEGKAHLVILAKDVSENTKKLFTNACRHYQVPLYQIEEDKETLGHAIGKAFRGSVAVLDEGFSEAIKKVLDR